MFEIFEFFFFNIGEIWRKVDSYVLFSGVSLMDLIVGFLVIGFVITLFWKGAKA